MNKDLKGGDSVRLSRDTRWDIGESNPIDITGTVIEIGSRVNVNWSNGKCNSYYLNDSDLIIHDEPAKAFSLDTTNLSIHCNGIEEVESSRVSGSKQVVTLVDCKIDSIINQIGSKAFFDAFELEELAQYMVNHGYSVKKED